MRVWLLLLALAATLGCACPGALSAPNRAVARPGAIRRDPGSDWLSDLLHPEPKAPPEPQTCLLPGCTAEYPGELGEITDSSVDELASWIGSWQDSTAKRLVVRIDSPGGSVRAGFRLAKVLERSKVRIQCRIDGLAASMAAAILQSCNERIVSPRSILMLHAPSTESEGQQTEFRNTAERLRVLTLSLGWQYCHRAKLALQDCRARFANGVEWWLSADEALAAGLVDRVD